MLHLTSEASLGIEINDSRLVLAEVRRKGKKPHLEKALQKAIPSEVMADGKVKQVDTMAELIRQTLREAKIRCKSAHLVVPSQFVVIRQLSLPDLPTKKLRNVIEFELQNSIHLPFEDPIFDFVKEDRLQPDETAAAAEEKEILNLDESQAELAAPAKEATVTLVASSRSAIDPLVESVRKAGLKPLSVDIGALALSRAFRHFSSSDSQMQTTLFVDVAENSTDIHIIHDGMLRFTRNVPMSLGSYAIDLERTKPLHVLEILEFFESNTDYRSFTHDLVYELERSVNFFRYTLGNRDAALSGIVLSGLLPKSGSLAFYLQERMPEVPVNAMPFELLSKTPEIEISGSMLTEYAISIGLALKEVK